jgi:hypothetical protein
MKNSLNLVLALLFFVVLGCSCPKLEELTRKDNSSGPSSTPYSANTSSTPSTTSSPSSDSLDLTMDKYNQLKTDMPKSEVERILGGPGTEISSSTGGGMTFSVFKWDGPNYKAIIISFRNDKIMSKSQVGLK